ncbi:MAG: guanylate kinase [Lentimicrobiaceae bacterium]|nr:guanylate kinase [Lentimicrobiaceae bacterium]MCB9023649.1 guanylate kinase [Lentimicrobiaceae bacterium]MCO5264315.1 guanylate kinase [Lentimicrobium sp.]HPG34684.1 guanylate kinase [Lentimicrobium sp.]
MNKETDKKLIIVSAPSGAGKTTIVKHLLTCIPELGFSVSATSRAIRAGETHGIDYFFISAREFRQRIDEGDLLEWEEVYPGSFYGTLKSEVFRLMKEGKHVIFDVDVVGGLNIKKAFGNDALSVFVSPPSVAELENRLKNRNTDSPETISKRIAKARWELEFAPKFDYILINNDLETAKAEILEKVLNFINN